MQSFLKLLGSGLSIQASRPSPSWFNGARSDTIWGRAEEILIYRSSSDMFTIYLMNVMLQ